MVIERTSTEILIRLPINLQIEDLQDFINYTRYKEIVSQFKVEPSVADSLAKEINTNWWQSNRNRLIKYK